MTRFTEVGDRVWVAHYEWMHVNITLVGGETGLLMVDTHGSERMARTVADDVRRLGAGPLTGIVNTHEHWDHTFGNGSCSRSSATMPVHAHDWAAGHTVRVRGAGEAAVPRPAGRPARRRGARDPDGGGRPDLLLGRGSSTSATGRSSWSTPVAATPRATSWCGSPTPTSWRPATSSSSPTRRSSAATAGRSSGRRRWTWCSASSATPPWWSRATGSWSTRSSCRTSAPSWA